MQWLTYNLLESIATWKWIISVKITKLAIKATAAIKWIAHHILSIVKRHENFTQIVYQLGSYSSLSTFSLWSLGLWSSLSTGKSSLISSLLLEIITISNKWLFGSAWLKKLLEDQELKQIVKESTMLQALRYVCPSSVKLFVVWSCMLHVSITHVVMVCMRRIVRETLVALFPWINDRNVMKYRIR